MEWLCGFPCGLVQEQFIAIRKQTQYYYNLCLLKKRGSLVTEPILLLPFACEIHNNIQLSTTVGPSRKYKYSHTMESCAVKQWNVFFQELLSQEWKIRIACLWKLSQTYLLNMNSKKCSYSSPYKVTAIFTQISLENWILPLELY